MIPVPLPADRQRLVTVALENDLNIRPGDELQVTTPDGRLSMATVVSEINLARFQGVPDSLEMSGDMLIERFEDDR